MSSDVTPVELRLTGEARTRLARLLERRRAERQDAIQRRDAEAPVLSFAQQQLWFLEQLMPGKTPYNVPIYLRLRGNLQFEALQQALDRIVKRHEVLRTRITVAGGEPKPAVAPHCSVEVKRHDLRFLPEAEREKEAERLLKTEAARGFDLSRDLLFRAMVIELGPEERIFFHNSHHIAWDLGSKAVFYRELEGLYGAYISGEQPPLSTLPIQYSDYAAWQRDRLGHGEADALATYWKEQLAGAPTRLEIPADRRRPRIQTLRGGKLNITLPQTVLDAAKTCSAGMGVSLFMTVLSAFGVLLYGCTGQEDILIGSPVDGRDRPEAKDLIGFFINTVVLRIRLAAGMSFRELARSVRETTLSAVEHAQLPFHRVVEAVRPPRDMSRSPLFQVNFRLQPGPPVKPRLTGLEVAGPYVVDNGAAKFDLSVELPSVEDASGFWEYSTDLFDHQTIVRMAGAFKRLLAALVSQPDSSIASAIEKNRQR